MKYQKFIIFSLVFVIINAALYYVISTRTTQQKNILKPAEQNTLQTQSVTIGTVTYEVTPPNLTTNGKIWDFEVSLDTHTGSLDQDLMFTTRLVDDQGNEYKPINWLGDPLGGHHRAGRLQFKALGSDVTFLILKIKPGENMEDQSLIWNIKGNK